MEAAAGGAGGRKVAWIVALAATLVLAVGSSYWQKFAVQYHVYRLHREPGYLHQILVFPKGTFQRMAIQSYGGTPRGREALFGEYADVVLKSVFAERRHNLADTLWEAVIWNGDERASYVEWSPARDLGSYGILLKVDDPARLAAINELLEALQGARFDLPEYPALQFSILLPEDALRVCPRLARHNILPSGQELSCLIRRRRSDLVQAAIPLLKASNNLTHLCECLDALGEMGPEAKTALPAIRDVVERWRKEAGVREAGECALKKIQGMKANFAIPGGVDPVPRKRTERAF